MLAQQSQSPTHPLRIPGAMGDAGWRSVELPGRGTTYAFDRPHRSPEAPTVVLLHGLRATGSTNWTVTLDTLSEHYRVIALDHRGHGRGLRGHDEFTLEDCADDAVALLDVFGVRTAIFVGYSMGGPIAQLIWRRHRDSVSGLVLCATAADFTATPAEWPLVEAIEQLQRNHRILPQRVRRRMTRTFMTGLVADSAMRNGLLDAMSNHVESTIHEAQRAIRQFRSTDWICDIDVPVVVVVTERDRLVRPRRQRQLVTSIPDAGMINVDAGHLAAFTQPDLIADAVATACAEVLSRSAPPERRWFRRSIRRLLSRRRLP